METDQLYQRAGVVLILLPLLGVLTYNLGRIDILNQVFTRIDVFLYYLFTFISYLCLGCSVVFAILFILPRKEQYKGMHFMKGWLRKYKYQHLKNRGKKQKSKNVIFYKITKELAKIQANNESINEKRRRHLYRCFLMASFAITVIGLQAILLFMIKVQYYTIFCHFS